MIVAPHLSFIFSSFATRSYSLAWPCFQLRLDDSTSISYRSPRISATSNELMKWQKRLNYQIILKQFSIFRGAHPHRVDLPRNVAVGKLPNAVLYTERRGAQPGVKRPTTHSAFNLLYMILYIGSGHTAGCAVLAFVCLQ